MRHGFDANRFERVFHQGIDDRYAGTNAGTLFGFGSYFACNASKSDIYTHPDEQGLRCVLVIRACLGEVHYASHAMADARRPPERSDRRGPLNAVVARTLATAMAKTSSTATAMGMPVTASSRR